MRWEDGEAGLIEMCRYGANAVKRGYYDEVRFDLFGQREADFVKSFMDENYPDVPYRRIWAMPGKPARQNDNTPSPQS